MDTSIARLVETVPEASSIEEFGGVVNAIRSVYDLKHIVYHAVHLGGDFAETYRNGSGALTEGAGVWRIEDGSLGILTYPEAWIARYLECNYVRIDPVVAASIEAFHPIDWKLLDWSGRKQQDFMREAVNYGLGNQGLTIPIRGPNGQFAIFTANKSCSDEHWEFFRKRAFSDLLVASHYFHQKIIELLNLNKTARYNLSARELDVLRGLSLGKNRAQIAHELGVSENTVRVYIDSSRHKLGALNTSHAVAIAVSKGVLAI